MLAGSRMTRVERNNNIVLEYRKSEVIRIALPERIEGKGGQTVSGACGQQSNSRSEKCAMEAPFAGRRRKITGRAISGK